MNTKEMLLDAIHKANENVPQNVLTTGRLIEHLLEFKMNIPVKVMSGAEELTIGFVGESPNDEDAWSGVMNMPQNANWYEIQVASNYEIN